MDRRSFLKKGTCLSFPGLECTIDSLVGTGASAIVYLGEYLDRHLPGMKHRVLVKELFPYDPKGRISRDEKGSLWWEADAEGFMRGQRLAFERGNEVHLRLLEDYPEEFIFNYNTFPLHNTLYSILGFSGGRSLDKEWKYGTEEKSLFVHLRRILGVLDALELIHRAGYLHLDVSPDNILLIGEGGREKVTLIDYNSVHTQQELEVGRVVYYFEKEGYSAPEVRSGQTGRIGPEADLYSLAAVLYHSVMGRPLSILETSQAGPPDLADAVSLEVISPEETSLLRQILAKGLAFTVRKRYHSAAQMREDVLQLLRIALEREVRESGFSAILKSRGAFLKHADSGTAPK